MSFDRVGALFDYYLSYFLSEDACLCNSTTVLGVFGVNWLDLLHGRLLGERTLSASIGFRPVVTKLF